MEDKGISQEDVDNFTSREAVFKRILNRYITSTNIIELSEQSINILVTLCRKCFLIVYEEQDSKNINCRIKLLDVEMEEFPKWKKYFQFIKFKKILNFLFLFLCI